MLFAEVTDKAPVMVTFADFPFPMVKWTLIVTTSAALEAERPSALKKL